MIAARGERRVERPCGRACLTSLARKTSLGNTAGMTLHYFRSLPLHGLFSVASLVSGTWLFSACSSETPSPSSSSSGASGSQAVAGSAPIAGSNSAGAASGVAGSQTVMGGTGGASAGSGNVAGAAGPGASAGAAATG